MRNQIQALGVAIFATVLSATAMAADYLQIGQVVHGGTGCPAGSVQAIYNSGLIVSLNKFSVQVGPGKSLDRKNCNLAVPIHVPAGYSIRMLPLQMDGFQSLTSRATATINAEYFFAGSQGTRLSGKLRGPAFGHLQLVPVNGQSEWSECGADTILRINISVLASANGSRNSSFVALDPESIRALVDWRACP